MKRTWIARTFLACFLALVSTVTLAQMPMIVPDPPQMDVKAYILKDHYSGKILASDNVHERVEPASLTKMMTMYVVNREIQMGKLRLTDEILVSEKAWRAEGSRMFIEVGNKVSVEDLIQGVIIQSGNDAAIALAEHIAGSEDGFAELMNAYAQMLGMENSNFTNATGLPDPNEYSTAHDLSLLASAIIREYPDDLYALHSKKWFTYNDIKQPNRNRLLWRNAYVDGMKTGSTEAAGYCLVATAKKDKMRLISVIVGAESDSARAEQSNRLLNYGFRFFETHELFAPEQAVGEPRIWMGNRNNIPVGLERGLYVTIPQGQYKQLQAQMHLNKRLRAPIKQGQVIGAVIVSLGDEVIMEEPLVALKSVHKGGMWSRFTDYVSMQANQIMGSDG